MDYEALIEQGLITREELREMEDKAWGMVSEYLGHNEEGRLELKEVYIVQNKDKIIDVDLDLINFYK